MVNTAIPHIRVNVSTSPLVSCYHRASGCQEYHLPSKLIPSGSTSEDDASTSSPSRLCSLHRASSSSLSDCPSASSASYSSLTQSTLSISHSDPQTLTSSSRIPASAILTLLDLLDAFDADVEAQVAHAKENIKETRGLVKICRAERAEKLARARRNKEAIERGTLAVDSEFWCSI